jgi:Delta7-sterol 5-desaturase
MFLDIDYAQPLNFILLSLVMFVIVGGRYMAIAGIFHLYFYVWQPQKWQALRVNQKAHPPQQYRKEIGWSMLTSLIFALVGAASLLAFQRGYTRVYLDIDAYGWAWIPLSLAISMLLHETYYYWLHRLMHHPKLYKYVHQVHHDSLITSPWTAFSFHPIEGLLEALILPAIVLVLPMHYSVVLFQLTLMTLSATINHLDIEIYPSGKWGNFLGRWLIGATHHALHHKQFRFNYGLYFTFWDKWASTESPLFKKLFSERKR